MSELSKLEPHKLDKKSKTRFSTIPWNLLYGDRNIKKRHSSRSSLVGLKRRNIYFQMGDSIADKTAVYKEY